MCSLIYGLCCQLAYSFKDRFGRNVTLAEKFETAVSLSLALVYYVRLDDNPNTNGNGPLSYRSQYVIDLQERTGQSLYINTALKQEVSQVKKYFLLFF